MSKTQDLWGWCGQCGHAYPIQDELRECDVCGSELIPIEKLSPDQREMFAMDRWFDGVVSGGLNGPSPGGAATALNCSRAMIDKLVDQGVLERTEYIFKDQKIIFISQRSILKAKENKRKHGQWTGTQNAS